MTVLFIKNVNIDFDVCHVPIYPMPLFGEFSGGVVYTYNYNDLDNHVNMYSYNFDCDLHSAFLFDNIFNLDFNVNDILTDIYFRHKK
jgi:hypothetical protein